MAAMLAEAGRAKYTEKTKGIRYRSVVTDPEILEYLKCEGDSTKYVLYLVYFYLESKK